MVYYHRPENQQFVWPVKGLMQEIPPLYELRGGRLQEVDPGLLPGSQATVHVPASSDGGQVLVQDAMHKIFDAVRRSQGRVIAYAPADVSSAAASVVMAADAVHVGPRVEVFFHAAAHSRQKDGRVEPVLPVPPCFARAHRDEVFSLFARIRDRDFAAAFHRGFSAIVADPSNQRDEFTLSADVLGFLGLAKVEPSVDHVRHALCANSGWRITVSDPVLVDFFESID